MAKHLKKPPMVREPVQVYLATPDRALLNRVAKQAGLSRAEVLRRGLRAFGADVLSEESPMLRFLDVMAAMPAPKGAPKDVALNHDDYLTDAYLDPHDRKPK